MKNRHTAKNRKTLIVDFLQHCTAMFIMHVISYRVNACEYVVCEYVLSSYAQMSTRLFVNVLENTQGTR